MLYEQFSPVLHSPCFHYLITHCSEKGNPNGPSSETLLSYDEVRTLMYIMLARRKDGISLVELEELYTLVDIQYHGYSWVSYGSTYYFEENISTDQRLDTQKLILAIASRVERFNDEYSKLKCSDFYQKLYKNRSICSCCSFFKGKKSNYALKEKYNLLGYMMKTHENFDTVVNIANNYSILLNELLYYNYDVRVCGSVPLETVNPLLIPFFQCIYHICSIDAPGSLNKVANRNINYNPDILMENDTLFLKLLEYLVSNDFIFHKAWNEEFSKFIVTKDNTFDFKKSLSKNTSRRGDSTLRWLESMYMELFSISSTLDDNFSPESAIRAIALQGGNRVFTDKETAKTWLFKFKHQKEQTVNMNYFSSSSPATGTSIGDFNFLGAKEHTAASDTNCISEETIQLDATEREGLFPSEMFAPKAKTNELNLGINSERNDVSKEQTLENPKTDSMENSTENNNAPKCSGNNIPERHLSCEEFLLGIRSVEALNNSSLLDKHFSQNDPTFECEHINDVDSVPISVTVKPKHSDKSFDTHNINNSENATHCLPKSENITSTTGVADESQDTSFEVTSNITHNVTSHAKTPYISKDNTVSSNIESNTESNINNNTQNNTSETHDNSSFEDIINATENDIHLLSETDGFIDTETHDAMPETSKETTTRYSKILFDKYIQYQRINVPIYLSRIVYYSPAEVLTSYPLDITMTSRTVTTSKAKRRKNKSNFPATEHMLLPDKNVYNNFITKDTNIITFSNRYAQKLFDFLSNCERTEIPRSSFVSFTDAYFANYDFSLLADTLPEPVITSTVLKNHTSSLINSNNLRSFETALIKDHCLCIEAIMDENHDDYLLFFINSAAITGESKGRNRWYSLPLSNNDELKNIIGSYIQRNSYTKICYSSHRLYAVLKKYNIAFRNIFSISSAIGVIAKDYKQLNYRRIYKNLFSRYLFDSKELPELMCMMRKNITLFRALQELITQIGSTKLFEYQQYLDIALGCSYLPANVFPVSECSLYQVVDYNTYYMNSYHGHDSFIEGRFIRLSLNKEYINSLEDYALVPSIILSLAYKGMFRKYHLYITEYTSYVCTFFVEEEAYLRIRSMIISEATNRIRIMFPNRVQNATLLEVLSSKANIVKKTS